MARLEFEKRLINQITSADNRPRRRIPLVPIAIVLVAAAVIAGAISAGSTLFTLDRAALTAMSRMFVEGLRQDPPKAALAACGEGTTSSQLLGVEEARVFTSPPERAGDVAGRAAERIAQLTQLRADLAANGIDWPEAQPLAFGGARAKVFDADVMREPAEVVIGEIYFTGGDAVYAVEVSAWHCGSAYIIVDVWNWTALGISAGEVKDRARQKFEEFREETGSPSEGGKTTGAKFCFVRI